MVFHRQGTEHTVSDLCDVHSILKHVSYISNISHEQYLFGSPTKETWMTISVSIGRLLLNTSRAPAGMDWKPSFFKMTTKSFERFVRLSMDQQGDNQCVK